MLLYRVFPYLDTASHGQPGHPLYVHPAQRSGRFDNPALYVAWYMAAEPSAAVGETFADLSEWSDAMFDFPLIPGSRRALGIYAVSDDLPYLDLDDPQRLVDLSVRPSQVVERNRPYTQALAARIYNEHKYNAIRWWSSHLPQWRVYCLWEIDPQVAQIEPLSTTHPATVDAGHALTKTTR